MSDYWYAIRPEFVAGITWTVLFPSIIAVLAFFITRKKRRAQVQEAQAAAESGEMVRPQGWPPWAVAGALWLGLAVLFGLPFLRDEIAYRFRAPTSEQSDAGVTEATTALSVEVGKVRDMPRELAKRQKLVLEIVDGYLTAIANRDFHWYRKGRAQLAKMIVADAEGEAIFRAEGAPAAAAAYAAEGEALQSLLDRTVDGPNGPAGSASGR